MLLAIDSSTEQVGLALLDGDSLRAELLWQVGREHTSRLLPGVDAMLALLGVGVEAISAVAVATGPGSFNGLRAGLAVAKGLCLARRLPLAGVSTLDITAAPHLAPGRPTAALVSVGRGRYALGRYPGAALSEVEIAGPLTAAGCGERLVPGTLVAGETATAAAALLAAAPAGVTVLPAVLGRRRAAVLAWLAASRLAAGDADDITTLEPYYLGESPVRRRAPVTEEATCT